MTLKNVCSTKYVNTLDISIHENIYFCYHICQ